MLSAGDPAPDFSLQDQDGNTHTLADYAGRQLLIYFYPRADTPGCTKQSCSVRDHAAELAARSIAALGSAPTVRPRRNGSTTSTRWASRCCATRSAA